MAVKLLRTYTMQIEALGKLQRGGQRVVKIAHVHAGRKPLLATSRLGPMEPTREGAAMETNINPMQRQNCQPRALNQCQKCGAKTRCGTACRLPEIGGKLRRRMHGGAPGTGAPEGERNRRYRHGRRTAELIAESKEFSACARVLRTAVKALDE
jgi:hypothetical protein